MGGYGEIALLVAGVAASAVGTAVSVSAAQEQGQAAANSARYQAQVANNNATIAQENAQRAAAAGEQQAGAKEQQTRGAAGNIRAAIAANDITLGQGSPLLVEQSNRLVGEEDAGVIRSNAANNAYGFETQGVNFNATSQLDTNQSSQALIGAKYGATGSILGGASQTAGLLTSYYKNTGGTTSGGAPF